LEVKGCVIYRWKGIFKTFPWVYYKPHIPNISIGRLKNKFALKFLSSKYPTLFDETSGSKFKGVGHETNGMPRLSYNLAHRGWTYS
jgi:hypothetical protein